MKRRVFWLVVLALMSGLYGLSARAAELSLFDVPLRDATPAALHAAALGAGARLVKSSAGHRVYDASRIALPGAHTLETLFDGGRFVVAAYSFKRGATGDYELRRLLAAKYGPAYIVLSSGKRHAVDLAERYPDVIECRWDVGAPLELIYNTMEAAPRRPGTFDYETRLTYLNRTLFEALQQRTAAAQKQLDRDRAGQLKGAF
jgi:hypothetical protein